MMRGNILASRRGELLQEIYDTVGEKPFRASDVPGNSKKLFGMCLDGMLDKVTKCAPTTYKSGHAITLWRISKDALTLIHGEKIDRNKSRRRMRS